MMATRVLADSNTADMELDTDVNITQLMESIMMPMSTR